MQMSNAKSKTISSERDIDNFAIIKNTNRGRRHLGKADQRNLARRVAFKAPNRDEIRPCRVLYKTLKMAVDMREKIQTAVLKPNERADIKIRWPPVKYVRHCFSKNAMFGRRKA